MHANMCVGIQYGHKIPGSRDGAVIKSCIVWMGGGGGGGELESVLCINPIFVPPHLPHRQIMMSSSKKDKIPSITLMVYQVYDAWFCKHACCAVWDHIFNQSLHHNDKSPCSSERSTDLVASRK